MGLTTVEDNIKAQLKVRKNAHIMLVEGMSKLRTHNVKTFQSSVFHIAGHKWKLIVHPAGKNGISDYLSLHLRIKDKEALQKESSSRGSNWEVKCSVALRAIAQTGPCHSLEWPVVCYNAKQAIYGQEDFMTHKVLNGRFILNDKVVFGVEITNVQSNCAVTPIPRTIGTAERFKPIDVKRNNSKFTWKITQFSSFNSVEHSSYEFTAGPRRWKIQMCPKGQTGRDNGLDLMLVATDFVTNGPKAKTLAVYKQRVLDQLHRKHFEIGWECNLFHYNLDHEDSVWGYLNFLSLEKLNNPSLGFLVNDQIYFGIEFSLLSTTEYL